MEFFLMRYLLCVAVGFVTLGLGMWLYDLLAVFRNIRVHRMLNAKELLPAEQFEHHSMEGLFNTIEADLNRDAQPGSPRTFCRGYFDAEDGHLHLFVRRVAGTPERVEIKVDEFKR
jgi:hypothetical protein